MPGASTNCKKDPKYIPDLEMEDNVIKKAKCIPKWSRTKYRGLNYCKSESDFERYFEANIESQERISNLPNKCNYNTWTALHYEEEKMEGNTTLQIILISINPKVSVTSSLPDKYVCKSSHSILDMIFRSALRLKFTSTPQNTLLELLVDTLDYFWVEVYLDSCKLLSKQSLSNSSKICRILYSFYLTLMSNCYYFLRIQYLKILNKYT